MNYEDVITDDFMKNSEIAKKSENFYIIVDKFYDIDNHQTKVNFKLTKDFYNFINNSLNPIKDVIIEQFCNNLVHGSDIGIGTSSKISVEDDKKETSNALNELMTIFINNFLNRTSFWDKYEFEKFITNSVSMLNLFFKRGEEGKDHDKFIVNYIYFGKLVYYYKHNKLTLDQVHVFLYEHIDEDKRFQNSQNGFCNNGSPWDPTSYMGYTCNPNKLF